MKQDGFKKTVRFVADALTGRLGIAMMVLGYSACAFVLLAYVSTQVYTYSLMEDIVKLEREQRGLKERIGLQTERYVALSSKDRIASICESRLALVQAGNDQLVRVSIGRGWPPRGTQSDFREDTIDLPDLMGSDINELTEVMRK
jgi:hypothetical protein